MLLPEVVRSCLVSLGFPRTRGTVPATRGWKDEHHSMTWDYRASTTSKGAGGGGGGDKSGTRTRMPSHPAGQPAASHTPILDSPAGAANMHGRGAGLRPNCGRNGSILEEMNGAMHQGGGGDPCFQSQ